MTDNTFTMKIDVQIPAKPELLASMFARMDNHEQAKALSMMWDALRHECGGAFNAAMQCHMIGDAVREENGEALELLNTILYVEQPEGFVLPVHREPSTAELMDAKRYIDGKLGVPQPKTYTVEKTHDDGSVSQASGLTADEVLACYMGAPIDTGCWPTEDYLASRMPCIPNQRLLDLCGAVQTTVDYPTPFARGRVVIRCSGPFAKNLRPNQRVAVHGDDAGYTIGTVQEVHSDGTATILLDPILPDEFKDPNGDWPRRDRLPTDGDDIEDAVTTCPECKGTGEYRGFTKVEPCTACNGKGER